MTHEALPDDLVAMATRRAAGMAVHAAITPARTALLGLNMQNAWLADGAPFDRAGRARTILPKINHLAGALREAGGAVFWLCQAVGADGWPGYFGPFVRPELHAAALDALAEGGIGQTLHPDVNRAPGDQVLPKFRFSGFLRNPYDLETLLRDRGIDTVIIAGTATNICCESTARDAMMRDFRVFMPHDTVTAPDREAHLAGVRSIMQVFGDVRPSPEIIALLK